jgi:uncharacterized protein YkwD
VRNEDRGRVGRRPLEWDDTLADIARAHSQDMRRTGVVAFVPPAAKSLDERISAFGPDALAKTTGNVARTYSISETHAGLMGQPTTRLILMAAKVTHIGIGVVYGDEVSGVRQMYVTELVRMGPP